MKKLYLHRYQLKDLKYYRRFNRRQRLLGLSVYQYSDCYSWDNPLAMKLPYIVEKIDIC